MGQQTSSENSDEQRKIDQIFQEEESKRKQLFKEQNDKYYFEYMKNLGELTKHCKKEVNSKDYKSILDAKKQELNCLAEISQELDWLKYDFDTKKRILQWEFDDETYLYTSAHEQLKKEMMNK